MVLYDNSHDATPQLRTRVRDLIMAGVPQHLIAKVIRIDEDTLKKHYQYELTCAEPEAIETIAKTVYSQAANGNEKSQALYLKTRGAKFGWVEKQVIETIAAPDAQALQDKIKELEDKYCKDY